MIRLIHLQQNSVKTFPPTIISSIYLLLRPKNISDNMDTHVDWRATDNTVLMNGGASCITYLSH